MSDALTAGRHDEPMFVEDNRPPTSEIADVFPTAQKVYARELRAGDRVFDPMGRTYALDSVYPIRKGSVISFKREDLDFREHIEADSTITIIRPTQEV